MRRVRALATVAALLVSSGCATAQPATPQLAAALGSAAGSVGRIVASQCDAAPIGGSAIALGDDLVLTAAHVAEHARTVSVRFPGRLPVLADAIGEEPTRDLLLLRTREPLGVPGVPLASAAAQRGDLSGLLGYPNAGGGVQTQAARVSETDSTVSFRGADQQFLRLDAESVTGNSGGAVIDQTGQVQGVIVAVTSSQRPREASRVVTLAVPVADVVGPVQRWRTQPEATTVGQACPGEEDLGFAPPSLSTSGSDPMTAEAAQLIWLALAGWNAGEWASAAQQYTASGRADLGLASDAPVVHWLAVDVSSVTSTQDEVAAVVSTRSVVAERCRAQQWRYQLRFTQGAWLIDSVRLSGDEAAC